MKTMMRGAVLAGVLGVLLSACGGSPTSSVSAEWAGPGYDGGYIIGAGNRTEPADTSGTGQQNASEASGQGYTIGAGN